jgi:hypothetical protein
MPGWQSDRSVMPGLSYEIGYEFYRLNSTITIELKPLSLNKPSGVWEQLP